MKDLQHDNARHVVDFHRVNAAAIMCYLLLDVKHPSPKLLLRDTRLYISLVRHAGGTTLLMYLVFAAIPVLTFQYATRAADGRTLTRCMAFAFHCHRSLAEKFKSVLIAATTLMGYACLHPKLVPVVEQMSCISLLGKIWMAFDRFLEYINLLQIKRGTAFRSFDSQLHFTEYLKPLVHVDAAWKEANGGTGIDDGIPSFLLNDVSEMRRKLVATLGDDLTIVEPNNALWHTGNPVPLDGDDYRERKPWEYLWQVAYGNSAGRGRKRMSWNRWVASWIENHW